MGSEPVPRRKKYTHKGIQYTVTPQYLRLSRRWEVNKDKIRRLAEKRKLFFGPWFFPVDKNSYSVRRIPVEIRLTNKISRQYHRAHEQYRKDEIPDEMESRPVYVERQPSGIDPVEGNGLYIHQKLRPLRAQSHERRVWRRMLERYNTRWAKKNSDKLEETMEKMVRNTKEIDSELDLPATNIDSVVQNELLLINMYHSVQESLRIRKDYWEERGKWVNRYFPLSGNEKERALKKIDRAIQEIEDKIKHHEGEEEEAYGILKKGYSEAQIKKILNNIIIERIRKKNRQISAKAASTVNKTMLEYLDGPSQRKRMIIALRAQLEAADAELQLARLIHQAQFRGGIRVGYTLKQTRELAKRVAQLREKVGTIRQRLTTLE